MARDGRGPGTNVVAVRTGALELQEQTLFRRELTPTWLSTAALLAGQPPLHPHRPLRMAEVSLWPGVQPAVAAACHPDAEICAVRLTPADAEQAQRLADDAGLDNLTVVEWLPALGMPPLPGQLDVIVLDDVISTIDAERRADLAEMVGRRLRPGGLLALSYRTLAGWVGLAPLRRLALLAAGNGNRPAPERVDAAAGALRRLRDGGALFIRERAVVSEALDAVLDAPPHVFERLLLTEHLEPLPLQRVVEWLRPTGAEFIASLRLGDDSGTVADGPVGDLLADTVDRQLREALREIAMRRAYRLDLFRRGSSPLAAADRRRRLRALALITLSDPPAGGQPPASTVGERLGGAGTDEDADQLVRELLDGGAAHPRSAGWAARDGDADRRCEALNSALACRATEDAAVRALAAIGSAVPSPGRGNGPRR